MKMLRAWVCVLTVTITATPIFCGTQTAPAVFLPGGDANTGKRLYTNYGCYQCHGYEGQGAQSTGPRLATDLIPFPEFSEYIREPRREMPPYTTKVVSDQELADIYAFLKSLPRPPDARSISLLN